MQPIYLRDGHPEPALEKLASGGMGSASNAPCNFASGCSLAFACRPVAGGGWAQRKAFVLGLCFGVSLMLSVILVHWPA